MGRVIKIIKPYALYIAFIQAWAATLGSLYFSEIAHLQPCQLCWYQRILMYPLVVLFTVAIMRRDKNVAYYALPLSVLGILVSFYQYLLQMTPLKETTPITCSNLSQCSAIDMVFLGFITIPFLSLMAFLLVTTMMVVHLKTK